MCATCGCQGGSTSTLTNLRTGSSTEIAPLIGRGEQHEHVHADETGHAHEHGHDYLHERHHHPHDHGHRHDDDHPSSDDDGRTPSVARRSTSKRGSLSRTTWSRHGIAHGSAAGKSSRSISSARPGPARRRCWSVRSPTSEDRRSSSSRAIRRPQTTASASARLGCPWCRSTRARAAIWTPRWCGAASRS